MNLTKEQLETLEELATWLEDQQFRPYQPGFNQTVIKWKNIIEKIIEEERG